MNNETTASRLAGPTQIEVDAMRLLLALESQIFADTGEARAAQRYGNRLRFALDRAHEMRLSARTLGGVFEPARLEVSLSILESTVRQASIFADRIVAKMPRQTAARYQPRAAAEAVPETPGVIAEERAA
jgi:hypothetical protein